MERFNKLTQVQKIVVLIIILVFVFLMYNMFKNLSYNMSRKKIDYSNVKGETLILTLSKDTSKATYYSLEDAIVKYLKSYKDIDGQIGIKSEEKYISYKDFYSIVTLDYKKYLGEFKYQEVANNFLDKFSIKTTISDEDEYDSVDTKDVIKNVYVFDENRYICEVSNSTKKITGYIGIELNPSNSKWYIFYIE